MQLHRQGYSKQYTMIDLLLLCLPQALAYVGNTPTKKWWGFVPTLIGYFADLIVANYWMPHFVGRGPQNGEKTVSDMLENLCFAGTNNDVFAQWVGNRINTVAGYAHIKVLGYKTNVPNSL